MNGVVFRTDQSMVFVEGMKLTDSRLALSVGDTLSLPYTFYMSYFIAGYFGPCFLIAGHPCVAWARDQVMS
jgi:hypothetical protein